MPREGLAEHAPGARDDVEDPVRYTGFRGQLGQAQRGQRRCRRRLEHDRVARGQRRADLPRRHDQRVVPRHDGADDTDRLTRHERERIGAGRADLAVDLVDGLGVPLDRLGRRGHVDGQRVADRLADIQRFEERQFFAVRADRLGQLEQDDLALGGRHVRPAPIVERRTGGRDRSVDVLDIALGDLRDHAPVATGDVVERPAGRCADEPSVDEGLVARLEGLSSRDPVGRRGAARSCRGHAAYLRTDTSSSRAPRPGTLGTRRRPSASGRIGSDRKASRRSGVQPGGSYGNSMYGPPPIPAAT